MLQPVVPYAITGLALGSLLKRPGAGALVGTLWGVAQTTSKPTQLGSFGAAYTIPRSAPQIALTIAKAKLAVGHAYKAAFPDENKGWSAKDIGNWSGGYWNRHSANFPASILRAGEQALRDKGYRKGPALDYLKKVKRATQAKPWSQREYKPYKPKRTVAKATAKAPAKKRSSGIFRAPVQGPREDTAQYVSASPGAFGTKWYQTTKGKIGLAAAAGLGSLVLLLVLTRK